MFTIRTNTQRVNVVIMTVFVLLLCSTFDVYIENLGLGHNNLLALNLSRLDISICARANFPILNYLIVRTEKFQPGAS